MASPDFWSDREAAQKTVNELKSLKAVIDPVAEIAAALEDVGVLAEIAEEDPAAQEEFDREIAAFEDRIARFEFQQMLNGRDDGCNAYMTIHAGAGGTESCDWTEMLLRMYLRWADRNSCKTDIIEATAGEEAGLRRVSVHLSLIHI